MKKFSLIGLLLFTLAASAGLRGVGLGGGYGEMQTHLADERLVDLVRACMSVNCGVTAEEVAFLASDRRELRIDTSCEASLSAANTVTISSRDLYQFSDRGVLLQARPFNEIIAVVFTARTGRPLAESLTLFQHLQITRVTTALTLNDSELSQHFLTVSLGAESLASLAIEGLHESVEITPQLLRVLNCSGAVKWQILRTTALAGSSGHYLAESSLKWTCDGVASRGTLKVFVRYTDHEIKAENIRISILP